MIIMIDLQVIGLIELKIWRGNEYNKRGEKQLAEYLEYYHLEKGYLLSFNFNKNKKIGLKEVEVDNKKIIEFQQKLKALKYIPNIKY